MKDVIFTVNGVSFTLKPIPGGTFTISGKNGQDSIVTLPDYYMGETEVTQALWNAVMEKNPSNFKGDSLPVENVSYDLIVEHFLPKLNNLTGKHFRLPTEIEWEHAARGRKSADTKYAGSNDVDEVAWYLGNSGGITHHVKMKKPNDLGLYDMNGNVKEWCNDFVGYVDTHYPIGNSTIIEKHYSMRGGSFFSEARICTISSRFSYCVGKMDKQNGFRLLWDLPIKN